MVEAERSGKTSEIVLFYRRGGTFDAFDTRQTQKS